MKIHFRHSIVITVPTLALVCAAGLFAQDVPRTANGKPDFSGVWDHPRVQDVTRDTKTCGGGTPGCSQKGAGELSFTAEGEKRWKGPRIDYTAYCLPWGYTRAGQVEYPLEIMQKPDRLAFLFESNNIFHIVFMDGRQHPKDLEPTWLG